MTLPNAPSLEFEGMLQVMGDLGSRPDRVVAGHQGARPGRLSPRRQPEIKFS